MYQAQEKWHSFSWESERFIRLARLCKTSNCSFLLQVVYNLKVVTYRDLRGRPANPTSVLYLINMLKFWAVKFSKFPNFTVCMSLCRSSFFLSHPLVRVLEPKPPQICLPARRIQAFCQLRILLPKWLQLVSIWHNTNQHRFLLNSNTLSSHVFTNYYPDTLVDVSVSVL